MKRIRLSMLCLNLLFASLVFSIILISSNAQAARRIESVIPTPGLIFIGTPTTVKIIAEIAPDPTLITNSVTLIELGPDEKPLRVIGRLVDDGTNGDNFRNDGIFTRLLDLNEALPRTIKLRISVAYRGTLQRLLSDIFTIAVTEPAFFTPPDPDKIVEDNEVFYPVNHVIIVLPIGSGRNVAEAIAAQNGGTIVGFSPSGNIYTLEVPTISIQGLNNLIELLRSDPRIELVVKNFRMGFDQVTNDLSNLRNRDSNLAVAYDAIQIQRAWELIDDLSPQLYPITVGIIDQGVNNSHPEYNGFNVFGGTPGDAFNVSADHGTEVAGIIGAPNLSGIASIPVNSPEMNGILAGLSSIESPLGSRIDYTLEVRRTELFLDQPLVLLDALDTQGARVVNMSFGLNLCDRPPEQSCADINNPIRRNEFDRLSTLWGRAVAAHPNIIIVASAGNAGINVSDHIPGGALLNPNIITVASIDPETNQRSTFSNFGDLTTIAAPGERVYKPYQASGYNLHREGTSYAAPMVTGTVGLLLAIRESLTAEQIVNIIQISGDKITTDQPVGRRLNVLKAVRFVAKPVDVFLLVDLTGSFFDDIATFKSGASELANDLKESGLNVHLGLGSFEDYPILPWGDAAFGDRAYELIRNIGPVQEDEDLDEFVQAVQSLTVRSGFDGPESQLPALFQVATGAGQDVPPLGPSLADIPAGQQGVFRSKSLRIVILWTDAIFHRPGDSIGTINDLSFPYPGPSFVETISALNEKEIKVIGIVGLPSFGNAKGDLETVAIGTETVAPPDGVDCDDDGTIDVPEGGPLVCPISSTGIGISKAIAATVLSLAE